MAAFLRWWLFVVLGSIGFVAAIFTGTFGDIWAKDATKISFIIIAIVVWMTFWCGRKTFAMCKAIKMQDHDKIDEIIRLQEIGWFASEKCMTLGMIGTVFGFIMMLVGFSEIDTSNVKAIQDLLGSLSGGMSTALYTTLVGLIGRVFLSTQYFNLEHTATVAKAHMEDWV